MGNDYSQNAKVILFFICKLSVNPCLSNAKKYYRFLGVSLLKQYQGSSAMNIFRRTLPVQDNTVIIHLPEDFHAKMVDVVVLPYVPIDSSEEPPIHHTEQKKTVHPIINSGKKYEKIIINGRNTSH
jgi:hypothetical protein